MQTMFRSDDLYSQAAQEDRSAPRTRISIPGSLRPSGSKGFQTVIHDLSISGFSAMAINRIQPGTFCWLTLPGHWSPLRFASKALSHNVRIIPGPAFSFGPQARDHGVRICFGSPATGQDLREALLKIRDLMGGDPEDDFTPVA